MPRYKAKNVILLVDVPNTSVLRVLDSVQKRHKKNFKFALLYSPKFIGKENKEVLKKFIYASACNFDSPDSIVKTLAPIEDKLKTVFCRAESQLLNFQKIIPYIPYLRTPTSESILWSINKYQMRRRFRAYDKSISLRFMRVKDSKKSTLSEISKKVNFPLVIKPVGLAQSLLVTIVYHKEELEKELRKTFRKLKSTYKDALGRGEPDIIVEEFIEGEMYSIDGYVNSRGKIYFCPMFAIKTGKQIGFDDFFGYQQMTPANLSKETIVDAEKVANKGVHALGLRSTAFHAEFIKRDNKWFILEIAARVGGFRLELYDLSYNINHIANAVDIAMPKEPKINKKVLAHSAALKFFAKKEGIITNITGIKKARELKSTVSIDVDKKVGDRAVFAKNGGKSVFNIILSNKERSKLLADIRRLEQAVKIEVGNRK